MSADAPDLQLALPDAAASCSLWWRRTPLHDGRRVGAIGKFQAANAESGTRLLDAACAHLSRQGCRLAIGPMDGNTWHSYRVVIERGDAAWFFLEPATPAHFASCFTGARFSVAATYCSSAQESLDYPENSLGAMARRAAAAGVRIRQINLQDPQVDLHAMHAIVLSAFERSFLFSPISRARFVAQYTPLLPSVRAELVLLAERDGEPVAFAFGIPDALEAARGAPPATVILKTVAARPGFANAGIAHLLVAAAARAAGELGYTRAVHALMHESNSSLRWSARHGRVFRRYALFQRALGPC